MIREVRVETLEDLLPLLTEQEYRPELGRNRSGYLYRGMPNVDYRMETSLSRCCKGLQNVMFYPCCLKTSVWLPSRRSACSVCSLKMT